MLQSEHIEQNLCSRVNRQNENMLECEQIQRNLCFRVNRQNEIYTIQWTERRLGMLYSEEIEQIYVLVSTDRTNRIL